MDLNPLIVDTDAPGSDVLLVSMDSEQTAANLAFIRREGRNRSIRFAKRTGDERRPFVDADIDPASVVSMAIGTPDEPPTSGTWKTAFVGSSTGLTGLAYNISAAALQTALNSNGTVHAAGDVTVTSGGAGAWIVTFNSAGARAEFEDIGNALVPPSNFSARTIQAGDVSTVAIQLITLRQQYLAFSNDFAPVAAGSIAANHLQTGDSGQPDIYRVAISGAPNGGTWLLSSTQAAIFRITPQANTLSGIKASWLVGNFSGQTLSGLSGRYIDIEDENGPVRPWFSPNGGGVAPATPAGGRLLPMTFASPNISGNPDDEYMWAAFNAAIEADSKYTVDAVAIGSGTTIRATTSGFRSIEGSGSTTLSIGFLAQGIEGPYQSTYFLISDANGSVAVWFNVGGRGVLPADAASANRAIEITTVTDGMAASGVVDQLVAALDADPQFAVADNGSYAELTMSFAGTRATPSNGTAPLGIATIRAGRTIAQSFPFDASAGQIQQFIGDAFTVTSDESSTWDFVGVANGANATLGVDGAGLVFAANWEGTFTISTANLFLAFAASDGAPIDSKFEIQVVEPDGTTAKFYQGDCEIRADVIDSNNLSTPGSSVLNYVPYNAALSGYTGGGTSKLDGMTTSGVPVGRLQSFVVPADGFRVYKLTAGTAAESSPFIIRPDDYAGGTNEKYWEAVL